METERKIKELLDEIEHLTEIIKKCEEVVEKRIKLRKEVANLMETYAETIKEVYGGCVEC